MVVASHWPDKTARMCSLIGNPSCGGQSRILIGGVLSQVREKPLKEVPMHRLPPPPVRSTFLFDLRLPSCVDLTSPLPGRPRLHILSHCYLTLHCITKECWSLSPCCCSRVAWCLDVLRRRGRETRARVCKEVPCHAITTTSSKGSAVLLLLPLYFSAQQQQQQLVSLLEMIASMHTILYQG